MSRIPYDASKESLYNPGNAKDFFNAAWQLDWSDPNILCAEMARLAYVKYQDDLISYLARTGFELHLTLGYEANGTQVFIAKSKPDSPQSSLIIAFRGTEGKDPSDLIADVDLRHKPWTDVHGGRLGRVHRGFAEALVDERNEGNILIPLQQALEPLIGSYTTVLITGHSLGAALAILTAAYFQPLVWAEKIRLFTFGSPLVGDMEFSEQVCDLRHQRWVDCCDIVTRIPPESLNYRHVGNLNYLNRNGERIDDPSSAITVEDYRAATSRYLVDLAWRTGNVPVRDLADHSPINYLSGVSNFRVSPTPDL